MSRKRQTINTLKRFALRFKFFNRLRKNVYGFDKYDLAGAYHWDELERNPEYKKKAELIKRLIKEFGAQQVLDVGCGDGAVTNFVANEVSQVTGIDSEKTAVRLAQENSNAQNVLYLNNTISDYEGGAGRGRKFDFIYSLDVIEHLPDPIELVRFAFNHLKEGGVFVIGTPLFISEDLMSPYHWKEFRQEELDTMLLDYFKDVDHEFQNELRSDGQIYERNYYFAICKK